MGQALYRQYRSKKLSELVGQEHITAALERALKKGTISHAYLFTGPRGIGKTSVARILAHEINALPYEDDAMHLDIIEIDAASNRRIDEIRDLRDKVHTAPASAKFKVYIIDEVHMLTREAFNALLKTLEEPPAHVIFILATTEVHKLPETIISRTQRYAFKPVETIKVVEHLKHIAKQENIDIADDALTLIAEHGEGSFRDSISLLDQVRNSDKKVTLAVVERMLGIAPEKLIASLLAAVHAHDAPAIVKTLQTLLDQGYEPPSIARQLGQQLRAQIVQNKASLAPQDALDLLGHLVDVPASRDPRTSLEIALLDAGLSGQAHPQPAPTPTSAKTMHEDVRVKPAAVTEPHPSKMLKTQPPKITGTPQAAVPLDEAAWAQVLAALKQKHNTLYSVVRAVQPVFGEPELTLECSYAFHQKRLSEARNKQIIADTIREVSGQEVPFRFIMAAKDTVPIAPVQTEKTSIAKPETDQTVKTVSNIFGGAELLES